MQGAEMSLFGFLFRRTPSPPPPVDTCEFERQVDETMSKAKRSADSATRRMTQTAGVREEDVHSETRRIMEGRPAQYNDLLRDLVRPPSKGHRHGND